MTPEAITNFLNYICTQLDVTSFADFAQVDTSEVSNLLTMSIAEAKQTLSLFNALSAPMGSRVLEVGAGYGFASATLSHFGYKVTALEPGGVGFEKNKKIFKLITQISKEQITTVTSSAENVQFPQESTFDVIISNNVLEHVQDVELALINLSRFLSRNGVMVHSCPNYNFPFEPHFGVPLVPLLPKLSRFLLPKRIGRSDLWKSLNFVTSSQVRKICKLNGLQISFRKGTMSDSILRLKNDREFRLRHPQLGVLVQRSVFLKILTLTLRPPTVLSTPMDFIITFDQVQLNKTVNYWRSLNRNVNASERD